MARTFRIDAQIARLLLASVPLLAAPAFAAPSYHISFERSGLGQQYVVTQGTPFQHADSYIAPGTTTATFTGSAFAYPGHVGVDNNLEQFWPGGNLSARYDVYSYAWATDFVISGPPGPVAGQLHLRVRASLSRAGGFAGNSAHGARLNVDARARFGSFVAMGDLMANNNATYGTGVLTGVSSPDVDFPFVLSGTFTVGTAFDVYIRTFGIETTYGNAGSPPNPGFARTDAGSNSSYGLFLEEVGGQVMALPPGYTLNSVSWGIVDNHFSDVLGVEPAPRGDVLRLSAYPNPFTGASAVSFDQPKAGHVRLQVFDVSGRLIRTLADEWRAEGTQSFQWDGRNERGEAAGTGIYFLRAQSGERTVSRRIARVQSGD